jgi:hypothetical protein
MANPLRGQFEVELPDGTKIEALLNMHAVQLFLSEGEHKLSDLDILLNEEPLKTIPALAWAGVRTHHLLEDSEPPISRGRFDALLGSTDWTALANAVGQALHLDDGTEAKKKVESENK